jgi:hypothetical protein
MFFVTVLQQYLRWHYGYALVLYLRVYRNINWFVAHFFSIKELTLSLFVPFRRITETRTRRFDIGEWASVLTINLISRLLGAVIRLILIGAGIISLSLLALMSIFSYAVWLVAPLLSLFCIVFGGYLVISTLL